MASDKDFVHLHLHSEYSALDGMGHINEYVDKVVELKQPGFGLSDHGNTFGVYQMVSKARDAGLTPTPGCEFYMAPQNPDGALRKSPVFYGPNGQKVEYDVSANGAYTHQTIFAINNVGMSNLFKLSSLSFDPDRYYQKPRIDFELLAEHSEGLVAFTGCPSSEISTRLLLNQDKEAYEYANRLKEVFGDRLFVEIMEHGMKSPIERLLLPKQMELSRKMGIPLIATNDAHYTNQSDHVHHEEMLCAQSGNATMSTPSWDEGGSRFAFDGDQFYLKSAQEMAEIFPTKDYPGALSNTLLVSEMSQDISLDYNPNLKPKAKVPEIYGSEFEYFQELIEIGFKERYGDAPKEIQVEAREKIDFETEVIHSSDYVGYFITVRDYLKYAKDKYSVRDENGEVLASSIGVGRGSVGGSVIAYVLGISEIDPVRWKTIFQRFLSEGRGDTYLIEYDDGTTEEVVVSESRTIQVDGKTEKKYIFELQDGDTVVDAPVATTASSDADAAVEVMVKPVEVDEAAPAEDAVELIEMEEVVAPEEVVPDRKPRSSKYQTFKWVDLGMIPQEELTDMTNIPF